MDWTKWNQEVWDRATKRYGNCDHKYRIINQTIPVTDSNIHVTSAPSEERAIKEAITWLSFGDCEWLAVFGPDNELISAVSWK